jgi:hypothetical protein
MQVIQGIVEGIGHGAQYLTKDIPKTKTADGFYEFTDIAGKHIRVKADDVATVRKED